MNQTIHVEEAVNISDARFEEARKLEEEAREAAVQKSRDEVSFLQSTVIDTVMHHGIGL